jgi:hypothetical protein
MVLLRPRHPPGICAKCALNTFALRAGWIYDHEGRRDEFHWGLSLSVRNLFLFEERDYRWYLTDQAAQRAAQ